MLDSTEVKHSISGEKITFKFALDVLRVKREHYKIISETAYCNELDQGAPTADATTYVPFYVSLKATGPHLLKLYKSFNTHCDS